MNDLEGISEEYRPMLEKAVRSLYAAQRDTNSGDHDFASSRAYYAAFYAVEAVLLTQNLSFSKHSAVISAFNQYFIKAGIFPKEFSKLMSRLFRERQIGDYDFDDTITEDDAQEDVHAAQTILTAITQYLYDIERCACKQSR